MPKHHRTWVLITLVLITLVLITLCTLVSDARADALVVTRAMMASTIAEVYVERNQIRVEIEIGVNDLPAFKNILPDESFQRLTGETIPLEDRLQQFIENDWLMLVDGVRLHGNIERILPSERVVRDEITGDPLPNQPADAELVIRVELQYPLDGEPGSVSIQPPTYDQTDATAANIGFVLYHQGRGSQ